MMDAESNVRLTLGSRRNWVTVPRVRRFLRIGALIVAVMIVAFWFFGGMNTGFTKSYVERVIKDPVTELEGRVREDQFVPGVDFLAAGLVASGFLFAFSWVFKPKPGTS